MRNEERDLMEQRMMALFASGAENFATVHEALEHEGDHCPDNRADIVAFLAHRLGADMTLVQKFKEVYDEEHEKAKREKSH